VSDSDPIGLAGLDLPSVHGNKRFSVDFPVILVIMYSFVNI